jgi:DNA-binding response OmpR family regulator
MLIVQVLEELGCAVEEAGTAQQASRKIAASGERLTAAIVDLGLPDRPGDVVIEELRRVRPGLPVLLASGRDDPLVLKRLAEAGPLQILRKPFQPDEIEGALAGLGVALPARR